MKKPWQSCEEAVMLGLKGRYWRGEEEREVLGCHQFTSSGELVPKAMPGAHGTTTPLPDKGSPWLGASACRERAVTPGLSQGRTNNSKAEVLFSHAQSEGTMYRARGGVLKWVVSSRMG